MRALVVSFILVASSPNAAHAQQSPQKAAEQAFKEAETAYAAKDYGKAVKGYLHAYQLFPSQNALLFNIGQAYRMSGDPEKALSYYEKFVAFEPGSPNVAEAKDYIKELTQKSLDNEKERDLKAAAQKQLEAEAAAAREVEERKQRTAALTAQRAQADKAGSGLRTGGLVVGGLGVVGVGVGIALAASDGIDAKSGVALGVGGAALVAGGVMYYLGVKQRADARRSLPTAGLIVPQVTGGSVGVTWITPF